MDQVTAEVWCRVVWEKFLDMTGQRSSVRMMSPAEWETMRKWKDSGLPLAVVLRAFQDTPIKGRVGSLSYFERPVREAAEKWQRALA